jgi:hypothetical protein
MLHEQIREGYDVFAHDGEKAFGAVRQILKHEIVVYVENAGDFVIPLTALRDVHDEKVIVDCGKLDMSLRRAIGHAHGGEKPGFPERA